MSSAQASFLNPSSPVPRPAPATAPEPVPPTASTPDRVAQALVDGIRTRRFAVGQRLIEADLMRDLAVGRSTVREALSRLAAQGVVQLIPHRGAVVRRLCEEDARALLEVLEVLTGLAARLAAERIDETGNRARFETASRALLCPRPDDESRALLDQRARYYQVLFEIADNRELDAVLPRQLAHLMRAHASLTSADVQAMRQEYASINEAIARGAAEQAERRMRLHIRRSAQRTLRDMDSTALARA